MPREQTDQLLPGVAGGAGDGDAGARRGGGGARLTLGASGLLWASFSDSEREYLYIPMHKQSRLGVY